jgi:hypothetical protein
MSAGYTVLTSSAVALAAGVAKAVLGAQTNAAFSLLLKGFDISFDGVTASAVPAVVEICGCTFATNPPGTASTNVTPVQRYGRAMTSGFNAAQGWTSLPTVLLTHKVFYLSPNGGLFSFQWPLGMESDQPMGSGGFVIRVTAPAIVNCLAGMDFERV